MSINYNHFENVHTLKGASKALPIILGNTLPNSLLDVGCGLGVWLKAALDHGITNIYGVDGVSIKPEKLFVPSAMFRQIDLSKEWNLNRKFDIILCLEVAEHLDVSVASMFIESLTKHSDYIVFASACPDQYGQNHVNCQWPNYWQNIFNNLGFSCSDEIRWKIWGESDIEPWYRQNMFIAQKSPNFGKEPRIESVIHPEMIDYVIGDRQTRVKKIQILEIEDGSMPFSWYVSSTVKALYSKLRRNVSTIFKGN
jgi:SAM-dependent methyltransferase